VNLYHLTLGQRINEGDISAIYVAKGKADNI